MTEWQLILREHGTIWFSEHIIMSLQKRSEIDQAGRALLSQVFSIGAAVTFDYRSFLARCRRYNSSFDSLAFFEQVAQIECNEITDAELLQVFELIDMEITMDQYKAVMKELCGDYEHRFKVFYALRSYLTKPGYTRYFIKYIFVWLEEREASEFALKVKQIRATNK